MSIAVKGKTSPEARALFLRCIDNDDMRLWDFIIFSDWKKLLSVSDYNDRIETDHFPRSLWRSSFIAGLKPYRSRKSNPREETGEFLEVLREMTQEIV